MTHGQLFAGIGGFGLAAQWAGIKNVWANEIDPYCCKILRQNFEGLEVYEKDIRTFKPEYTDIITGGFPCQPFSHAGKRKGTDDNRYLWPEMLRVISEVRPRWVIGENVAGLLSMENGKTLDRILTDLEDQGYHTETFLIPASATGAWHRRDRIWILANSGNCSNTPNEGSSGKEKKIQGKRRETRYTRKSIGAVSEIYSNNGDERIQGGIKIEIPELIRFQRGEDGRGVAYIGDRPNIPTPVLCRSYDGVSSGVDRIKALGNAIVPQVAYEIFKAITLAPSLL